MLQVHPEECEGLGLQASERVCLEPPTRCVSSASPLTGASHGTWMFGIKYKSCGWSIGESVCVCFVHGSSKRTELSEFYTENKKAFNPPCFSLGFLRDPGYWLVCTGPLPVKCKVIIGPNDPRKTSFSTFSLCVFFLKLFFQYLDSGKYDTCVL